MAVGFFPGEFMKSKSHFATDTLGWDYAQQSGKFPGGLGSGGSPGFSRGGIVSPRLNECGPTLKRREKGVAPNGALC